MVIVVVLFGCEEAVLLVEEGLRINDGLLPFARERPNVPFDVTVPVFATLALRSTSSTWSTPCPLNAANFEIPK